MRPTARNSAAARCPLLWHRHFHRDHGLAVLEVGHDGGQIGAADQGEQPLFVVTEAGDAHLEVIHDIDVGHDGMVRHAFERLVAEVPGLAAADHGPIDLQMCAKPRNRVMAATMAGTSAIWFSARWRASARG